MSNYGLDYGSGNMNIDKETGIRYGVINQNEVMQAWSDSSEADYGPPTCGKCGNEAVEIDVEDVPDLDNLPVLRQYGVFYKHDVLELTDENGDVVEWDDEGRDFACLHCYRSFDNEDAYGEDPLCWYLDDGEYKATCDETGDIFITKSPYFTHAQYCSPCAPGACYLTNPVDERGPRAYCFAPDFFDYWDGEKYGPKLTGEYCGQKTSCPYPVYRVDTGECIFMPNSKEE